MRTPEMEALLKAHYGETFPKLLKKAQTTEPTLRGALNSLRIDATIEESVIGSLIAFTTSEARYGQFKGQITSVRFVLLTPDEETVNVYGNMEAITYMEKAFPALPAKLTSVGLGPVRRVFNIFRETTNYQILAGETSMKVLDDGVPDFTSVITDFSTAVAETEGKADGTPDPWFMVYGVIRDVRIFVDEDTDEMSVKATIEDATGRVLRSNIGDNLKDLFGDAPWLGDRDKVQNAILGLPVVLRGRVFIGFEGQDIGGRPLERDTITFVVKDGGRGVGWILNLDEVSDSIFDAVVEAAEELREA